MRNKLRETLQNLSSKKITKAAVAMALLIVLVRPTRPVVPLGPQQEVATINSKMGVHTRLTDEVEEWKIKQTLSMVRQMGAPWIVEYFPWSYIEPLPGLHDWRHADLVVDHANQQGLTVIARLGLVPDWARPRDSASSYLPRDRYGDFGDFVYDFVDHFEGQVDYIIIWNEPNLALEWGFQPIDPEGYTELLKIAYREIKARDPNIIVISGALSPTGGWVEPDGRVTAIDDFAYFQGLLNAGM